MSTFDIGKIRFHWTGNFDQTVSYEKDDCAYYQGDSWVYISELTPAAYDATVQYSTGDLAIDGSDVYRYIDTNPSTGNQPSASPSQWELNTPTTTSGKWQKMAQGADLGSITGISAGDLFYYDGSDFVRVPAGASHTSLVVRNSAPIYKPQGVIQVRKKKQRQLMRVNSGNNITAFSWYPIDQLYDNSAWVDDDFEVAITPKFANSILKVELSLHVGWRSGSYHAFGRITNYDGTNWVRHPDDVQSGWHSGQACTEADHGAYTYTSNGATYVYQGEQVQLTKYYDVDGVNFTAGTETKFRWEYTSTSGSHSIWLNTSTDYYNQNYSRAGNSFIAVTEINNGD